MTQNTTQPMSSVPSAFAASAIARPVDPDQSRFLSETDCLTILRALERYGRGGGETSAQIVSRWRGNVRWGRNRIISSGEDRDNRISFGRSIGGAVLGEKQLTINEVSAEALVAADRRAERLIGDSPEQANFDVMTRAGSPWRYQDEEATAVPPLFFASTFDQDASKRAEAAVQLMHGAAEAGMLSAGYIEVSATSFAYLTSWGYKQFYQYTWAQYSTTVRDPKGVGSGWAGVDWPDWSKIDGAQLSAVALDKCLKSRNPVAVEPGRYTTILEPQAVCDFLTPWGFNEQRWRTEGDPTMVWHKSGGDNLPPYGYGNTVPNTALADLPLARFGERVIDERLTVRTDPMDPMAAFPPYAIFRTAIDDGIVYHPVTWIEQGVLRALPYDRGYGEKSLGQLDGLPGGGGDWLAAGFHVSVTGATVSIPEMIEATKRGLLVTRLSDVRRVDTSSLLYRGFTRDGLWLIEDGKISKPVKNMMFVESQLFVLNNVEQVGEPQRTFHPAPKGSAAWASNPAPVVVPALKVKDFSFTALSEAI